MVVCLLVAPRANASTIDGPEFTRLAEQSVDVMRDHHWLLKRQLDLDAIPHHLAYHINMTFADIQFGDGRDRAGSLERHRLTLGLGKGEPTTGGAYFFGVQFD